jgi:hypothetical protein
LAAERHPELDVQAPAGPRNGRSEIWQCRGRSEAEIRRWVDAAALEVGRITPLTEAAASSIPAAQR